ncbi:unnamed protein product, partial [Meganyctiphanes norvegica]
MGQRQSIKVSKGMTWKGTVHYGCQLAEGAFGVLHQGVLDDTNHVSITTITPGTIDPDELEMEFKVLENFRHRNLVSVLGVSCQDPCKVVMEELKLPLLMFLRAEGRALEYWHLMYVAVEVARGMQYLHEKGYIHGDLAAQNIWLGNRAKREVKISHYGLANLIKVEATRRGVSSPFSIKWSPPESYRTRKRSSSIPSVVPLVLLQNDVKQNNPTGLRRQRSYTNSWLMVPEEEKHEHLTPDDNHRSLGISTSLGDIWAFGVFLMELVTYGDKPYRGMTDSDVMLRVSEGYRLPAPSNCQPQLYSIMIRCWDKHPPSRPSFRQLKREISKFFKLEEQNKYTDKYGIISRLL